jgi:DNA primase
VTPAVDPRVDIADVRARHRIQDVVAASGVELRRTGRNLMGCCPFHDDDTASLSVGGVPDRFHCFGCGASGNVIDYVTRLTGLPFRDAVAHFDHTPTTCTTRTAATARASRRRPDPAFDMTPNRAFEINDLAWRRFTRPVNHEHALAWLRTRCGIDLARVEHATGGSQVGYAAADLAALTRHLLAAGVSGDELTALDLAQSTRRGTLKDTLRNRLVVPVRDHHDRITGFLGRDTSQDPNRDPRTPKYRNPTRTPVFDKAQMLYAVWLGPPVSARAVVVEGPLDVLAVAAAAASADVPVVACSTAGVSASMAQARAGRR